MNKKIILFGLILFVFVSALTISAQTAQRYRAEISFDFSVGKRNFEAGEYSFERLNPLAADSAIVIRSLKTGKAAAFQVNHAATDDRGEIAELTFHQYGDKFFLAGIATPTLEASFSASKREKSLANINRAEKKTLVVRIIR